MSNYLLVVSDEKTAVEIVAWVGKYSDISKGELKQLQLGEDRWLTYVSRAPSSECRFEDRVVFKGFAIDYVRESIALGADGFSRYLVANDLKSLRGESLEGCYFSARWDERHVEITNDLFSLCPILYTSGRSFAAVSDSAYVLASLRRALGLKCTLNERSVIARSWGNAMAGQLLSEDTLVDEVKYAHVGTTLRIQTWAGIDLRIERRSVLEDFSLEDDSYAAAVREAAQRIASSLNTLAGISMNVARFAISGGMDSRVCLAAGLMTEAGRQQAVFNCVNTNSAHAKDYRIVKSLSEEFGFPLGLRPPVVDVRKLRQQIPSKLGLWFLSSAGIYDFMYLTPAINTSQGAVSIGGHGAELHKGNYGWRRIRAISATITDKLVAEAFRSQCEDGIAAMGVEPDDVFGSEWHYLGFRNAIHSGRFVTGSMTGFRPLMTRNLVALSRSKMNEWVAPKKGGQSLISDLLICLSPSLAAHPFDDESKNIAEADVQARSQYLGSLSPADLVAYRVFGSFSDIVSGFPQMFSELVSEKHRNHTIERHDLAALVEQNYQKLDGRVREIYAATRDEALTKLADETLALAQMRASIGKLLSFELVD